MHLGTVTEFGDERGLGAVTGDDGSTYVFHVVEIADRSRSIDVGQRVTFRLLPRFGMQQAGEIHQV